MKNYTQVYVNNSLEAAQMYCEAFDAEITRAFLSEDGKAYAHCELSVNGEGFLALAEGKRPYDASVVHQMAGSAQPGRRGAGAHSGTAMEPV